MTFDPNEFLRLADELGQHTNDEAKLRVAIGRAYYSVMLRTRKGLGVTGKRNIHNRVIVSLRKVDKAAGDQLAKLETLRGVADYELTVIDPTHQDWPRNWRIASGFAAHISGRLARRGL